MNVSPLQKYSVAVITSLYRGDDIEFAQKALDSIVAQKRSNIITGINIYLHVDGKLTENHQKFLNENRNLFKKIIYSGRNIGLAAGLNRLLGVVSDEEYLFRVDLDDICVEERFLQQVQFMDKNRRIDLCGTFAMEIDQNDSEIFQKKYHTSHDEIVLSASRCMPILHPTFCFRWSKLKESRIVYPVNYLTEDIAIFFQLEKHGFKFANIPLPLYKWRRTDSFYERRNFKRSKIEFMTYMQGIYGLHGVFTYKYIYPFVRIVFRIMPTAIHKLGYQSKLRNIL